MIRTSTLARLRRTANASLTETCDIYGPSRTVNDMGAPVTGSSLLTSSVACRTIRLQRGNPATMTPGEREVLGDELRLMLPFGTVLGPDYQVDISGVRYEVVRVVDALTDKVFVEAMISRRR